MKILTRFHEILDFPFEKDAIPLLKLLQRYHAPRLEVAGKRGNAYYIVPLVELLLDDPADLA